MDAKIELAAKQAARDYQNEWRKKNKEKVKEYRRRYWEKKAREKLEGGKKDDGR